MDGKTSRGWHGRHLLAVLDHRHGMVLSQVDVAADALHAQRAHAEYLVTERGAHYLITVKRNQPRLHAQLAALPVRCGQVRQ